MTTIRVEMRYIWVNGCLPIQDTRRSYRECPMFYSGCLDDDDDQEKSHDDDDDYCLVRCRYP
jgi:hypothetical protein